MEEFAMEVVKGPKEGWEFERKHIFILSSSGKPIFSRYGDEQELVTTFGLLQAVISIIIDSNDNIKLIQAGSRRIVYFIKKSLYFIIITSTNEPAIILIKHLDFLYQQILLVLTSKVHDIYKKNSSADIRELLGIDTIRLIQSSCEEVLTPVPIVHNSINCITCSKELRADIISYLSASVNASNAVLGILLYKDKLIGYAPNSTTPLNLSTADIMLLIHYVSKSISLRYNNHNWIPICMPEFNSNGFLQAYVSDFKVTTLERPIVSNINEQIINDDTSNHGDYQYENSGQVNNNNNNKGHILSDEVVELTVILVASSADPEVFRELLQGKAIIEYTLNERSIATRLLQSIYYEQSKTVNSYLASSNCLHYLFKHQPLSPAQLPSGASILSTTIATSLSSSTILNSTTVVPLKSLPSQFVASEMRFPLDTAPIQESILTQYQRLSICLRKGSSTVEATLFSKSGNEDKHHNASNNNSNPCNQNNIKNRFSMKLASNSSLHSMGNHPALNYTNNNNTNNNKYRQKSVAGEENNISSSVHAHNFTTASNNNCTSRSAKYMEGDDYTDILASSSSPPSSDYSLSYVVLSTGMVIVAIATSDSELYATFPSTITPLEASALADTLSRALKADASQLFQVTY